jgi:GNAT superfamily N-acetyltransferase
LIGLALGLTVTNGIWKGLAPEYALLGGILKQAIRDSRQLSDGKLRREAWQFLQNCAPVVAEKVGKGATMAAWHDLIQRVEALEEHGLVVATEYHGQGLPKWLLPALGDCDVFMLNAKNVPTDSTLCIVRLSELERLLTAKAKGG